MQRRVVSGVCLFVVAAGAVTWVADRGDRMPPGGGGRARRQPAVVVRPATVAADAAAAASRLHLPPLRHVQPADPAGALPAGADALAAAEPESAAALPRVDITAVGLGDLIRALNDEVAGLRAECFGDDLAANAARIPKGLGAAARRAAAAAAFELAAADYAMRSLRNRILADEFVYRTAPPAGPPAEGCFTGQAGELGVGGRVATYVLNLDVHDDLAAAWRTTAAAQQRFRDAIAPR